VNIPNIITVFRIFLVPLVIWLIIDGDWKLAFFVFLFAGVSDALDGYLAKTYGWQTELGAYLDPIADKVLLVSIYVVLGLFSHIPAWLVIAVVSRDILIVGAFLLSWMLDRAFQIQPIFISKANTTAQIVLAALVLCDLAFTLGIGLVKPFVVWATGILTIMSAYAYLVAWLRHMATYEPAQPPRTKSIGNKLQKRPASAQNQRARSG
jgi:cardiolipin synthase